MNRTNQILAAVLAVQVILVALIFLPGATPAAEPAAGPLLANFAPDAVTSIIIQDNNDHTIALARADDGSWVLPAAGDFPADSERVEALLDTLTGLTANRLIARNPSSHSRLNVTDDTFQRLLTLNREDGSDRLYIGSSAGSDATHMRVNDAADVYLVSGLAAWEAPAQVSSWVDTAFFSVPQADITAIQVENANGTFAFTRADDTWTYDGLGEGETFDPASISGLLRQVASVRLSEPLGLAADDAYGTDEPQAVITLTITEQVEVTPEPSEETGEGAAAEETEEPISLLPSAEGDDAEAASETPTAPAEPVYETVERTVTLFVGATLPEDEGYAFTTSESPYVVRVMPAVGETFLNVTHDSLLVVEEVPDAGSPPDGGAAENEN